MSIRPGLATVGEASARSGRLNHVIEQHPARWRRQPVVVALLAACAVGTGVQAQSFPSKPIRMVVGFPPGGTTDIIGRAVAARMTERMKQQVVVDNRPGASGIVGADIVAKARPDGYTLLMSSSTHGTNLNLYSKLPYDTVKDFAPIALVATTPYVLVVHPTMPVKSVNELITYVKARPGKFSFCSSSNGTAQHLAGELLKRSAGLDMQHVPYKGTGALLPDLLSGRINLAFENVTVMTPHIKTGALRPLAVTSAKRSAVLPDIATMVEAGVPGFEVIGWFGIFSAAQTPPEVVGTLNSGIAAIMKEPDVRERIVTQGGEPLSGPPSDLRNLLAREIDVWGKVIRDAGIRAD
ncbi:MAG: tripartite tricarboxylate transporter substrate binding protein [Burkholderiales bacterium]|nr:tripartite tricarboxylate transporter substrate binding protein [Burkholderiales bacterium]